MLAAGANVFIEGFGCAVCFACVCCAVGAWRCVAAALDPDEIGAVEGDDVAVDLGAF